MADKKPFLIEIDDAKLNATLGVLDQLPTKGRSLREIIAYLVDGLNRALERGYSYKELSEVLAEQGISIAESTLKQYITEINKSKRAKPARRKSTGRVTGDSNNSAEVQTPATDKPVSTPAAVQTPAADKPVSAIQATPHPAHKKESRSRKFVEMPDEL